MKLSKRVKKFSRKHPIITILIISLIVSIIVPMIMIPTLMYFFPI